jgi:hypothetical protein
MVRFLMLRSAKAAAVTALFLLGLGQILSADTTVGTTHVANCMPFDCEDLQFGSSSTYQQVYVSSAFSGVTPFNRISFFLDVPGNLDSGAYDISCSYTSEPVDGLSDVNPSANIGFDQTFFGSYVLGGGPSRKTLTFNGSTFDYNPRLGNLLMTVVIFGSVDGVWGFMDEDNSGTVTSHADFSPSLSNVDSGGLVTRFSDVAGVPEPTSLALLSTCILLAFVGAFKSKVLSVRARFASK